MRKIIQVGAVAVQLMVSGCVAIEVSSPKTGLRQVTEEKIISRADITGAEPLVATTNGVVNVRVYLLGSFDIETRATYMGSKDRDEFMAVGFFPGVMSCEGEYRDCVQNAAVACWYNLVFGGLPTLYGLLVEPFVPYYPYQTESIIGQKAFLKSTLMGFSRYSKPSTDNTMEKVWHLQVDKMLLEDATIAAPGLGLESERGCALQIPVTLLPESGEVEVTLRLPEDHPLKDAMSGFEDAGIIVQCLRR